VVFWVVTGIVTIQYNPEDGGSKFLQNINIYLQNYNGAITQKITYTKAKFFTVMQEIVVMYTRTIS
jgi:hypothetical protein